jgi:holo-[acyl-carrier-protein] synthase
MIYGVGTDLCDVRRIAAALERHGERFAQRILAAGELVTWRERTHRWPERGTRFLATRFAAKEAFSKAVGLGLRAPMRWRDCEVGHLPSGQPTVVLHGALAQWCAARGLVAHLSVSDEGDLASAFCVVERG